jgi:hypothetical protein
MIDELINSRDEFTISFTNHRYGVYMNIVSDYIDLTVDTLGRSMTEMIEFLIDYENQFDREFSDFVDFSYHPMHMLLKFGCISFSTVIVKDGDERYQLFESGYKSNVRELLQQLSDGLIDVNKYLIK